MSFQLKNIQQLDTVSYDEVDKIILIYEDIRDKLTGQLIRNYGEGALHMPEAYQMLDDIYAGLPQSRNVRKHRAILAQMKKEFLEESCEA